MTLPRFEELSEGWKTWPPVCISVLRIADRLGIERSTSTEKMGSAEDLLNEIGAGTTNLDNLERLPEWLKTKTE